MNDYGFIDLPEFIPAALPLVLQDPDRPSNHFKFGVYNQTFGIKNRPKYTGFEYINIDYENILRNKITAHISQNGTLEEQTAKVRHHLNFSNKPEDHQVYLEVYKNSLVNKASEFRNQSVPTVIYYSGGADSEMVVKSFLAADTPFLAIIGLFTVCSDGPSLSSEFEKLSIPEDILENIPDGETIVNFHDVQYALEFAKEHEFPYSLRIYNVEAFWQSTHILDLSVETGISSPQILAQRFLSDLVEQESEDLSINSLTNNHILYYDLSDL